ncbi:MAG: ParA family protein, partial [Bacillota bacterium]
MLFNIYYTIHYNTHSNPSLGLLTVNALSLAQSIIIPLEPSIFALDGIEQLINVIKLIKKKINPDLDIRGVLLTRVDGRTNIGKEFEKELKELFGDKVFTTVI